MRETRPRRYRRRGSLADPVVGSTRARSPPDLTPHLSDRLAGEIGVAVTKILTSSIHFFGDDCGCSATPAGIAVEGSFSNPGHVFRGPLARGDSRRLHLPASTRLSTKSRRQARRPGHADRRSIVSLWFDQSSCVSTRPGCRLGAHRIAVQSPRRLTPSHFLGHRPATRVTASEAAYPSTDQAPLSPPLPHTLSRSCPSRSRGSSHRPGAR